MSFDRYQSKYLIKPLIIFTLLFFFGFIHAYHLVVSGAFVILYSVISLWAEKQKFFISLVIATIAALGCFILFFQIVDTTYDRPDNPYGLFAYRSKFHHLLPGHGVIGDLINNRYINDRLVEGHAYITLLPFLTAVLIFIKRYANFEILQGISFSVDKRIVYSFYAGLGCFLIAFGIHLFLGEWLFDLLPPLRQFRALGRFSWPFYYCTFLFSAIILGSWIKKIQSQITQYSIIGLLTFILAIDAFSYHTDFGKLIEKYKSPDLLKNEKSINSLIKDYFRPDDFQGILPFPSGTEGAEKFNLKSNYFLKTRCLPFSYQSGLPMSYAIMSRMSRKHMFRMLELANSKYGKRIIRRSDFGSDKPMLIVINNPYKKDYQDILDRSQFINQDENISLYSISMDSLLLNEKYQIQRDFINLETNQTNFDSSRILLFEDFVVASQNIGIDNQHGCYFNQQGKSKVVEWAIHDRSEASEVEFSFWNKILTDKSDVPVFDVKFLDRNGETILFDHFRDWDLRRTEVYDNWVRYKRVYDLPANTASIEFWVKGKYQYIDNVLLKSIKTHVFRRHSYEEAYADHLMIKM